MPPCSAATAPIIAATPASSATSQAAPDALPPWPAISAAAASAAAASMSASTTWAPRAASAVPKALPKPRPPPVITATLPWWAWSPIRASSHHCQAARVRGGTGKTDHSERMRLTPLGDRAVPRGAR